MKLEVVFEKAVVVFAKSNDCCALGLIIIQVDSEIKSFHFVIEYEEFELVRTEYERLRSNPKRLVVDGQKLLQIVFDTPDGECILKIQDLDSGKEPILERISVKSLTSEVYSISFGDEKKLVAILLFWDKDREVALAFSVVKDASEDDVLRSKICKIIAADELNLTVFDGKILDVIIDENDHFEL